MKSAIPFGRRYIDLYLIHYKSAFAFSSILYPPENSVFVTSDFTRSFRPLLDSVGLTLLYRLVVSSLLDAVYSATGIIFTRFNES